MKYTKITRKHIDFFNQVLGSKNILIGKSCELYASDHTENLKYKPEAVLFPNCTEHVSSIVSYCNNNSIPITPSAALTGLSGGALPVFGGISLSMRKMCRLISLDEKNFQAVVEPGLINQEFQDFIAKKKLFYPPDPASKGSCTLGGNLALNAGGPKALKYGVTSSYVLNLEIVLANGNVMWTGANTLKNATGYNLTQLIVGSEGTLAIITKAVLKLLPLPTKSILMLIPFQQSEEACKTVARIMYDKISPSSLELMEKEAVLMVKDFGIDIPFSTASEINSYLIVELDGHKMDELFLETEKIYKIVQNNQCGEVIVAATHLEKERIWKVRRSIGLAVKSFSVYKEEDTVVPRASLSELLLGVKKIGKKYNFRSICYGHAGDGNLHVNILKENLSDYEWNDVLKKGIREIFELCVHLGGTISGEHGIGLVQKEYLDIPFSNFNLELQKKIKKVFDPNNILNPGKIFNN